jgi:hypothetical protein
MHEKDAYLLKMEAELKEWSAKCDTLKAQAEKARLKAILENNLRLELLDEKKKAVQAKLEELRAASDSEWQELKTDIQAAWADLTVALNRANAQVG